MEDSRLQTDLQTILDCLNGTDGGVGFVKLHQFLKDIEHLETHEAKTVKDAFSQVARVVDVIANDKR